ncbi:MAG: hypothetical protein MJE66_00040 [Proteobacteria bacterium]|nr:hypothetical protein [Pseudomonadota bacterium]
MASQDALRIDSVEPEIREATVAIERVLERCFLSEATREALVSALLVLQPRH